MDDDFMNDFFQEQDFMDESLNSVTPFEYGGYDISQGNSWNMDFNN